MATTHIISIHVGKGKTAHQSLKERLDYIMNPEKTDGGLLISTHACSPETAAEEFMLYRQEYLNTTGRKRKDEVLAYHVRQAFKPGEITREKANEIGKKLAERLTDKQHAFVVATHIDKQHIPQPHHTLRYKPGRSAEIQGCKKIRQGSGADQRCAV